MSTTPRKRRNVCQGAFSRMILINSLIEIVAKGNALSRSLIAILLMLTPVAALAAEANVVLEFTQQDYIFLYVSLGMAILALFVGWAIANSVLKTSAGSEKMQEVSGDIKQGALAYLKRQVMTMIPFVIVISVALFLYYNAQFPGIVVHNLPISIWLAISFVLGVAASYTAGYVGMIMAVNGNARVANAALTSYKRALEIAFRSGSVAGLITVGMGLLGATVIFLLAGSQAVKLLIGFGFGGSLAALFMRVGGGIYTKAADVGADLVGKVEAGIPEDDPRNPATIADNVGDNVGDCAGMAADVFESYEVTLVAAIVLGAATAAIFDQATWMKLILFALMARGVGIIASILGIFFVVGSDDEKVDPLQPISRGFWASALIAVIGTAGVAAWMMQDVQAVSYKDPEGNTVNNIRKVPLRDLQIMYAMGQAENPTPQVPTQGQQPSQPKKLNDQQLLEEANKKLDETYNMMVQGLPQDFQKPEKPAAITIADIQRLKNDPLRNYTIVRDKQAQAAFTDIGRGLDKTLYAIKTERQMTPTQPGEPPPPAPKPTWTLAPESQVKSMKENPQPGMKLIEEVPIVLGITNDIEGKLYWILEKQPTKTENGKTVPDTSIWSAMPEFKYSVTKHEITDPFGFMGGGATVFPDGEVGAVAEVSRSVEWWRFFIALTFGVIMAFIIERLTDYFVSFEKKPVREIAAASTAGPAPMIIQGFAYAMESSVWSVIAICSTLLAPLYIFPPAEFGGYILSFYGIALVGLGLLTTTGYILAMDTFGPISDNAQGVYQMSGAEKDEDKVEGKMAGSRAVQRLDAAGNTTKALTKGFAIATAVVAAVALFHSFVEEAKLVGTGLPIDMPEIFIGLLVGGAAPFLFSAFSINAVGRASFNLIGEVRRQFKADPGIMAGTSKPDYGKCVSIVTAAAQKELLGPGILAIALPVLVAFGLSIGKTPITIGGSEYILTGAQALGGFLAGSILSGQLLAVLLANSGGAWDNAKKTIEDGDYGGKGSEAHKAGVVCDTVGDPFKDTAGPALNPLIKVMNLVALLLAPAVIAPIPDWGRWIVVGICVLLLATAVYWSKRGSIGSELQKTQKEATAAK